MSAPDISAEERRTLLRLAREAIEARLSGRSVPAEPLTGELNRPRGAFVTLKQRADGELRGCVGFVAPGYPLAEAVARAAVAAAVEDGRFDPVRFEELPRLTLDISVLSPLEPIQASDVRVGEHGLVIRCGGHSGLLLPQVATEHGWDREAFLEQTCRKAGLPAGTWQRKDAELLAFSATVFGEGES
jgi:AmmeMemoRadiSam system protein A